MSEKEVLYVDFYTTVLRKSSDYWVALCFENGLAGQGHTKEEAVERLREVIESFADEYKQAADVYSAPLST